MKKLVRDHIPDLIRASGEEPVTRILNDAEYLAALETKLDEEVAEYNADKSLEELADILEVVLALAEAQGGTRDELLSVYQSKHDARGGFEKRIFLEGKK